MAIEQKFPSELVDLPSKGWYYAPDSPLASGQVELKYLTAREEDILTSRNLIQKGVVLDKLMDSLILGNVKQDDLLVSDWDGLIVAARILGYGKDYGVTINCPVCGTRNEQNVDLTKLDEKPINQANPKGVNEFKFPLPFSKRVLTYHLLTHGQANAAAAELTAMQQKIGSDVDSTASTRLKYIILAVDGVKEEKVVREFVDNQFLARDSRAFRDEYNRTSPGLDLHFDFKCQKCGEGRRMTLPIGLDFFWPPSGV